MNDRYVIIIAIIAGLAVLLYSLFLFIRIINPLKKMNKDLSEELEKSKKREIALMDKEKETFATVGRELSEPITMIKLTAELLRTRLITEKGAEAVETHLDILF